MINIQEKKIKLRHEIVSQDLYKTIVAISLGLLGFAGTFFTLKINVGMIRLDFIWSLLFPMLVTQAWGRKYGLISLFIGLGAFYPFYLWLNEGWGCVVGFSNTIVWFILHGYGAEKRKQLKKYIYNIFLIEVLCLLIASVFYFFIYPLSIKYNSYFFYKNTIATISIGTLRICFIKVIVQNFFVLIVCDVLLLLPNMKKLFLYDIESKSRNNEAILARAVAICIGFWFLAILIENLLPLRDNPLVLSRIFDDRDVIYLIILIMFCMTTAGVTIRYLEKRHKAEELVKRSEKKYHDIFENIMNLYCETLIDGTIVEISPCAKNILGYDRYELIGKNVESIFINPESRKTMIEQLLKEKSIENLEFEGRKKDGTSCNLLINFRLVSTEDGIMKIISVTRDMTDYMEAKRKQAEVQEEYKLIFDKMIDGIIINEFIYNEANEPVDAIAVKANPAIERHLGLKVADVIKNTYTKSFEVSKSELKRLHDILITDIPLQCEAFTPKLNRHLLVNVFKVNNKQVGIMFHDISELKQLEAKKREMAEYLEAVFESTDDIIYSVDRNYHILNFNSSLKDYIKRSYNFEIESGRSMLEFLPGKIAQKMKYYYDNAMKSGRYSFEYHSEHEKRYNEVFLNPIYHNGEICGTAVFIKDITKRKEAEQQLIKINQELEHLVEERTSELRSTLTELEAFTYTVSHDLKSPLRAIDGYSRIILEDYGNAIEKEVAQMITNIANVSCDMINLIDRVLQYSISSKASVQKERVNIEKMFINVFNELKTTCMERSIEFNIETEIPIVAADQILIRQAVYNILSNAIKFTKNKGISIISVSCIQNRNEYVFKIKDNGAGFDMKYSKKLFTMFQRLHNKDEYEGNGIGLATVYKIIQKHGGRTWIESELNKGTNTYFTLPME